MSGAQPLPAFQRLFPRRHWLTRRRLALSFWSVLAPACLIGCLLVLALLVELTAHRGRLIVPAADREAFTAWAEGTRLSLPAAEPDTDLILTDTGLLPTVWRWRTSWWSCPLANAWQRFPFLQRNMEALICLLLIGILLAEFRIVARSKCRTTSARIAMDIVTGLRRSIHRQAMRLGPSDLEAAEQRTALDLFQTVTDNVRESLTHWLSGFTRDIATIVLLVGTILAVDWRLGLQCLIPFGAIWWIVNYERTRGQLVRQRAEADAAAELRPLSESLRKTRLVRGYAMEDYEHEQFNRHLGRYSQRILRGRLGETWALRSSRIMAVLCIAVIIFLLVSRALSEFAPLDPGAIWLIAASLFSLAGIILALQQVLQQKDVISQGADRIYRYLAEIPEVAQAVGAKFLNPVSKSIILENVSYSRNGQTLLDHLDLRFVAGTKTAIVSSDPLAPRAIAYLLPRFLEPQSGRILFDSEDIAWATLESLRAEAIFVGGDDPFFTGTVLENITCGETRYTLQDAMEAAKLTHAHKFISALGNGYETLLGEHGEQLRPGEGFRLSLARAVLRKPALMIIEEPKERLDDDTKALIDDAYSRILNGRTAIFLPTRLSTIRACDQVVFLQNGKSAAIGPHTELVRGSEIYRHWEYLNHSSLSRQNG